MSGMGMTEKPELAKREQPLNRGWSFSYGLYNAVMSPEKKTEVNLPHDYMIGQETSPEAMSGPATGFYDGKVANYTKYVIIPAEWKGEKVCLHFDGVMMNASVEVNGSLACLHHYGYTPFEVDITKKIYWGEKNRLTVTCQPGMQPNSRWYTGAGIYRHVTLVHKPAIHIASDGIFTYTKALDECAYLMSEITVENDTADEHIVDVVVKLVPENFSGESICRSARIHVGAQETAKAFVPVTIKNPMLWEENNPNLYRVEASVRDAGIFGVALESSEGKMEDRDNVLFGIRTISADSTHGLRINGKTVKLKGGCVHHDNGILGSVSFYDSEYRKLSKLKELGYNAVRTAHNPPSDKFLEACDRLGIYVFNEAFDAWGMAKQPGDYSQFFERHWKEDIAAFMKRDRNHPSVLFWSTGNEIMERGGLGNGYQIAADIAGYMKNLDSMRLISNGVCSYWCGLDDKSNTAFLEGYADILKENDGIVLQNASENGKDTDWEERTEPFVNALDVVGYNYMDDHYELDGSLYPERVILGTESVGMAMMAIWEKVERLPYVIGDFAWTCYDYIGEAGIGRTAFMESDDPRLKIGPFALESQNAEYPWRLANDADLDINGNLLPQGAMRRLLWGTNETYIFSQNPAVYGKTELISPWGWPDVSANWNWQEMEGKPVKVVVYSSADEIELFLNGEVLGKKAAGKENGYMAEFELVYQPGELYARGWTNGRESTEGRLKSTGKAAAIRLAPEQELLRADGDSLCYVSVDIVDTKGDVVTDANILLTATVEGVGCLLGFGSAIPKTIENYTKGSFMSFRGKAMAVVRSGYEEGEVILKVEGDGLPSVQVQIKVK